MLGETIGLRVIATVKHNISNISVGLISQTLNHFRVIPEHSSALFELDGWEVGSSNWQDSVARRRHFGRRDGQDAVSRQAGLHAADVVAYRQQIAACKLSLYVAVSVLSIVMLGLDGDARVVSAHGDLLRRERMHVHDYLVLIRGAFDRRPAARHLAFQIFEYVAPWPKSVADR